MVFRLFKDEDKVQGATGKVDAGRSNTDRGTHPEKGLTLPWLIDPDNSWVGYSCWVECELDAGIALHKPLPQGSTTLYGRTGNADTLAAGDVAGNDFASIRSGVNTKSRGGYRDVVQKMATSTYRFTLRGWGIRVGYQVPVPGLVSVAGVEATPGARQWSRGNPIVGNFGGVPLFYNDWSLEYYVTMPPAAAQMPPTNLAAHIRADTPLPDGIQVPISQPDVWSLPQPTPEESGGTKDELSGFSIIPPGSKQ